MPSTPRSTTSVPSPPSPPPTSCRHCSRRSTCTPRSARSRTRSPTCSVVTPRPPRSDRRGPVDAELLAAARGAIGFMPDDEGLALHDAALDGAAVGPLLEIGTYCGKSAVYLGAAARERGTVAFTLDHHRGSEENQAGWEHHDTALVDPRTGRMDT